MLARWGLDLTSITATVAFRIAHSGVVAHVLWPRLVQAVRASAPGVRLVLKTRGSIVWGFRLI